MDDNIILKTDDIFEYFEKRKITVRSNKKIYSNHKEIDIEILKADFFKIKLNYCMENNCKYEMNNFHNKIYLEKYLTENITKYIEREREKTCYDKINENSSESEDMSKSDDESHKVKILTMEPEKKKLSQETIKTYTACFKKMEKLNIKKDDYVNVDHVLQSLENESSCTTRNCINAIIKYFNENSDKFTEEQKEAIIKYRKIIYKMQKDYTLNLQSGILTQRQRDKYIEWTEIIEIYDKVKDKANTRDQLIMGLYLGYPRRNDFRLLTIANTCDDMKSNEYNYYVVDKKIFVFLKFKNNKETKDEDKIIDVDDYTAAIIEKYINETGIRNGENIFGKIIPSNKFSELITKVFKKHIGHELTSTILRHSFTNYDKDQPIEKQRKNAIKMSHSYGMHQLYRRK